MKNLLFVLSVLAFVALGPALAQGNVVFEESGLEGDLLATEFVGADLYTTVRAFDGDRFEVEAVPEDWELIGSISDVVLGVDGRVRGVLVDVGGFLGLGARTVMLSMDSVRIATQAGSDAVYAVIHATREDLQAAPEYLAFDRVGQMPVAVQPAQPAAPVVAQPAQPAAPVAVQPAQPAAPVAAQPAAPVAVQPAAPVARPRVGIAPPQEGFATVEWSTLSVDQLRAAEVYDIDNQRVSGISDILFGADGTVEAVLIDVGGFLGIGQRSVAIPMDQLEIQGKEDLSNLRVYLAITEQQLEALPEHVSN